MPENWVLIYSSPYQYEIEILKNVLAEHGIESIQMNKQDSAYLIGDFELYVTTGQSFEATQIISRFKSE